MDGKEIKNISVREANKTKNIIKYVLFIICVGVIFSCDINTKDSFQNQLDKTNVILENEIDNSLKIPTTYVLRDKYGKGHIYDSDLNEIITFDTELEYYNVGIDNKTQFICIKHKLIESDMARYNFYDMKGNKLDFEFEMEDAIYQISTPDYYVFRVFQREDESKNGFLRVSKKTREVERIKELNGYNYFDKFAKFYILSIADGGEQYGTPILCDENFNFIKVLEGYTDSSYYFPVIVDICGNKYWKLFADGRSNYGGQNLLDENGDLLFEKPYEVIKDSYDSSEIELRDVGKHKVIFDINKRQIINNDEINNIKNEERIITNEIEKKYNIKIKDIGFVENNKDLVIVGFEDYTSNIYNKSFELLFENVGYINYLELNGMKISSNNKKTVVVDDNYKIIKSLDEDYEELKICKYKNKTIIKGQYLQKSYGAYIEAEKYFDEHLNLIDENRIKINSHFITGYEEKWDLINYGMFVVGNYYYKKYDNYCNDLIIYDFNHSIIKKFDKEYSVKGIILFELNDKKYYLAVKNYGQSDLYDDKFNIILEGISYIDTDFLEDGVLVCKNHEVSKYSKDFKSKELIFEKANILGYLNDKKPDYYKSKLLFFYVNGKPRVIDKNGELVFDGYNKMYSVDTEVVYFEKDNRKGYIRYSDKKEVSVEK